MTQQLFVVERYDDAGPARPGQHPVAPWQPPVHLPAGLHLACAVHVPLDDAVLALVEGADEQTVCAALAAVGWRVDRIMPAAWAGSSDPHRRIS